MVGEEEDVPFRFLARPKITNGDRQMRLSCDIHDPLDELDRHSTVVVVAQLAFDQRVFSVEQLETQILVGKKAIEPCTEHALDVRITAQGNEIVVGRNDDFAIAHQKSLNGRIGKAAHALGLELLTVAFPQIKRDTAKR